MIFGVMASKVPYHIENIGIDSFGYGLKFPTTWGMLGLVLFGYGLQITYHAQRMLGLILGAMPSRFRTTWGILGLILRVMAARFRTT